MLVDSSVWIDFFNGRQTPQTVYLDTALGQKIIVTGDLILTELLQGFRRQQEFEQARSALLKFPMMPMVGQRIAIQSAVNYRAFYTIYKETGSKKWTAVATLLPVVMGFVITFFVAQVWRLVAGVG